MCKGGCRQSYSRPACLLHLDEANSKTKRRTTIVPNGLEDRQKEAQKAHLIHMYKTVIPKFSRSMYTRVDQANEKKKKKHINMYVLMGVGSMYRALWIEGEICTNI
jgi:hypothetical protein